MANGTNIVILRGHLGADPETRYTPSNQAVTNLRIATSSSWKDRNSGERRSDTQWHNVVVWGQPGEFIGAYAKKGSHVQVVGQLKTRKWQDKQGQDRWTTEVVVSGPMTSVELLDPRDDSAETPGADRQRGTGSSQPQPAAATAGADFDDDIPF